MSTRDPQLRVQIKKGSAPGTLVLKTLPCVEFEVVDVAGGKLIRPSRVYIDPSDSDKAEYLARRALKKSGITGDDADRIAREFAATLELVEDVHEFEQTVATPMGGHEDGLLKMAYELAWHWLGDAWLDDLIAGAMRDKLNGREPTTPIRGKIYDDPNVGVMTVDGDPRLLHVAFMAEFHGELLILIRLFDVLTVGFAVSADARQYRFPAKNAIIMHTVQRKYEEATFAPDPGTVAWHHDPATSPFR